MIGGIRNIHIVPTGDELVSGRVSDTSSGAMARAFEECLPGVTVRWGSPVRDSEDRIIAAVDAALGEDADLVVVSGGSGDGARHLPSLAPDLTHGALLRRFPEAAFRDIRGKEGHLWCRIVAARHRDTLVVSVPGPHVEAVSAAREASQALRRGERDPHLLAEAIVVGVLRTYPSDEIARP